jgi:lipid-A-disaccharide synthase
MPKRIMMVAGEASGDLHGASLAKELRVLLPGIEIMGMGGMRMAQEDVRLIAHCGRAAVVGGLEILGSAGAIAHSFTRLYRALRKERPDLLILIDFPDFNLLLGRLAKRQKIPIIYYISPQIWAWRSGRIKTLRRLVNKILVILPFEEAFYKSAGMDVHFVGHPLLDQVKPTLSREEVRLRLGVPEGVTLVGLLPGSRRGEVHRHLPLMMEAASILNREVPGLSFVLSQAESIEDEIMTDFLSGGEERWKVWKGRPYDLIQAADFLIVASGTVTLEAGLLGTPMVIIYALSRLSAALGRMLIRGVKHVGLVNLVLEKGVVPELLQDEASPEKIARVARGLLEDKGQREAMRKELLSVRSKLGDVGASRRAALQVAQFVRDL